MTFSSPGDYFTKFIRQVCELGLDSNEQSLWNGSTRRLTV